MKKTTLAASGALVAAAMTGLFTGSAQAATTSATQIAQVSQYAGQLFAAGTAAADEGGGGQHDCKGHNECKGKGGCKSGDGGCKGKNSCKGKGGCKSSGE